MTFSDLNAWWMPEATALSATSLRQADDERNGQHLRAKSGVETLAFVPRPDVLPRLPYIRV